MYGDGGSRRLDCTHLSVEPNRRPFEFHHSAVSTQYDDSRSSPVSTAYDTEKTGELRSTAIVSEQVKCNDGVVLQLALISLLTLCQ